MLTYKKLCWRWHGTEIPGSLVSEPKHRDSRFESRLGTGLGIEIQALEVSESVSEPKLG